MKKLILLPILLLALTACGSSSSSEKPSSSSSAPSSSSSEISSSSSSSSSEFVADTRVWRVVGSFGTSGWDPANDTYLMVRTAENENKFAITVDDMYVGAEMQVVHDGAWDGQLGFAAITSLEPAGCFIEGSGYDIKNAQVAVDGKYTVTVDTTNHYVPKVTVVRVGDPTNPAPTEVIFRVAGSMNAWSGVDDAYLLTETATLGTYEITLDLYLGATFKITKNGSTWIGASNLGTFDAAQFSGTDNIAVLMNGNYTVQVVDGDSVVINITRLGEPIVPPAQEADNGGWYLTGTINSWTITDVTSYPLTAVEGQEHTYSGTFDFVVDAEFVVNAGGTYDLKRGPSKVQLDPAPIGIDVSGDNIKVTEAGSYKVTFIWATDLGGVIVIENLAYWDGVSVPEGYMSISAILAEATPNKVYTTRAVVVGINGGSIFLEGADGSAINVYNGHGSATLIIKDTVLLGNVVDAVGSFVMYNNAPELDATDLTLVAKAKAQPIAPFVIADAAALTARMGSNTSLSGQLVRLNGVTVGAVASNKYTITFGTATVTGYSFYATAYEGATPGTGRTAINTAIGTLNTGATTFNIVGVLYSSNATGAWSLGITSISQVNVA